MKLESLELRNVRLFNSHLPRLNFREDAHCVLFLGSNGTGKTTILTTIATLLSSYTSSFPGIGGLRQFKANDIHITDQERMEDYLMAGVGVRVSMQEQLISLTRTLKGLDKPAEDSNVADIRQYAEQLKEAILRGEDVTLPIVAYYNTERGRITSPERKRDFATSFERWDCYKDSLSSDANFKRFFMWFDLMASEELHKGKELRDYDYQLPELKAVRMALTRVMGEQYSNPRIELHPLRFVMDERHADGSVCSLRIEQLSDGFRIMTAMVADIASRMAEANPGLEDPLSTPGIVLIDEVDLHLHPTWQKEVIPQLVRTFPNVQFIVSTHSPSVVLGAMDVAQVVRLENGEMDANVDLNEYSLYDVSLLLLSELFGVDNVRSAAFKVLENELMQLLAKTSLTDVDKQRMHELSREIGKYASV